MLSLATAFVGCTTLVAPTPSGPASESSQRCLPDMTNRVHPVPVAAHQARADPAATALSQFTADALRLAEVVEIVPVLSGIAELAVSSRPEH